MVFVEVGVILIFEGENESEVVKVVFCSNLFY